MQPLFPKTRTHSLYYNIHCVKSVQVRSYSGQHFAAFGLNTERYTAITRNEENFEVLLFYIDLENK